ncbi:MAG: RNA 2'-phosphotransferase [Candidatus Methylacidiphilales bacterium]|nr:RNA 2'-phosphotransferase [Candidatus Methylacidiphilales bacterium]
MGYDKYTKTSRFMSSVLRHNPDSVGIRLDANGWVKVEILLEALHRKGHNLSEKDLAELVRTNDKQRFAFSEDGERIRASQGHSVPIELGLQPQTPPDTLYHGTIAKFWDGIMQHGLLKMKRTHVHLSPDIATAEKVGARHGKPLILSVATGRMHQEGHLFYHSENGVWLVHTVPPQYLTQLPL